MDLLRKTHWLQGKRGGILVFLLISALVVGGLGWATAAVLRLENEQREARAEREVGATLRLALWRLDARVASAIAREDSRAYNHYSVVSAPPQLIGRDGQPLAPGSVIELSPLINPDMPEWMRLHFQAAENFGWASPQVPSERLRKVLEDKRVNLPIDPAVLAEREMLLADLVRRGPPPGVLLAEARRHEDRPAVKDTALVLRNAPNENQDQGSQKLAGQEGGTGRGSQYAGPDYYTRLDQKNRVQREASNSAQFNDYDVTCSNLIRNGEDWLIGSPTRRAKSVSAEVSVGPLTPLWLKATAGEDWLLLVRIVHIDQKEICQGIVLDWPRLQSLLVAEVADLFPDARILPVNGDELSDPARAMTALPLQLDPGPEQSPAAESAWTPLRIGLGLSWAAALAALLAVGLGGRSLLDLSERRIRFVSAVTHELRTPLTTLRLYLDMLTGGMVTDEAKKAEYLGTLNTETDRLHRLVANVLDFSRLENKRPRLTRTKVALGDLLSRVLTTWQGRCQDVGKELVMSNEAGADKVLETDVELVQQILANLIDNACKYSRDAVDKRICLRARPHGKSLVLEVEDRGPGVARRDRRILFRPFRRGRQADLTAGGVGLGLALADRWARLLGGALQYAGPPEGGACFRLLLPWT